MEVNPKQLDALLDLRRKRKEIDNKITAIEGGIKATMKTGSVKAAEATSAKGIHWRFTLSSFLEKRLDTDKVKIRLGKDLHQYQKEVKLEKFIAKII